MRCSIISFVKLKSDQQVLLPETSSEESRLTLLETTRLLIQSADNENQTSASSLSLTRDRYIFWVFFWVFLSFLNFEIFFDFNIYEINDNNFSLD